MDCLKGKRVTVAGLGRFGGSIAVSRWLVEQGAKVLVTDRDPELKLSESKKQLEGLPIEFVLGQHREEDFVRADLVVASPAIPRNNPYLAAAGNAGVAVTTEMCLFIQRCPSRAIFGVSGTKGKSTTTAILGEMLATRYRTWVGGNIGGSLLSNLTHIGQGDMVVLELSSYMLDYLGDMKWSPHVGLITMIAADHLEWHGSLENYLEAKKNLIRHQGSSDFAVLNLGNAHTRAMMGQAAGRVIGFSLDGCRELQMLLPGRHNQLNAQGALAAAGTAGITFEEAQVAVRHFKGLPHRLQIVHEEKGVRYVNDSIATIPEAAVAALEAFEPGKVIQIVGGYDKHLDMSGMCQALGRGAKAVLCMGATGPALAKRIQEAPGRVAQLHECGDLARAMALAKKLASAGDVILLSTGCASYDQFVNFEQRGEEFARLARQS